MAVAKKTKSMEEALWESANKLRGSVEPAEYKHIVLSLIFLKFAYDKFVIRREELIANGEQQYIDMEVVLFLRYSERFSSHLSADFQRRSVLSFTFNLWAIFSNVINFSIYSFAADSANNCFFIITPYFLKFY